MKSGIIEGTLIGTPHGNQAIENLSKNSSIIAAVGKTKIKETFLNEIFEENVIDLPTIAVKTKKGYTLTSIPEHQYFAAFTKNSLNKYFVYLMFKEGMGYRIGTTKLLIKNRATPKQKLTFTYKKRLSQEKADFLWFLEAYEDNEEALFYEQFYSIKYGLPTWIFYSNTRESKHSEHFIKKLFKELNTKKSALALLKDLHMFPEYPHHIPCSMNSKRQRNFSIILGTTFNSINRYKKTYTYNIHHYSISGIDTKAKEKLNNAGFKTLIRKSKKGGEDHRIESASISLKHIYEIIKKIKAVIPINVTIKGSFSTISLPTVPASHVLPGMSCFIENNGIIEEDIIESVEKKLFSGKIYDLKIDSLHNIITNNIVTYSPLNTSYE